MQIKYTTDGSLSLAEGWDGTFEFPIRPGLQVEAVFPALSPLYTRWEMDHNTAHDLAWVESHFYLVYVVAIIYLMMILALKRFMRDRPAYDLRRVLQVWNLSLAIFSAIGSIRLVTQVAFQGYRYGVIRVLSLPAAYFLCGGGAGVWVTLFVWSKWAELFDTVFLLLRKRHVSFLHWYHHFTVLIFTWTAYALQQHASLYFATLNYIAHAIMYFYYYLASRPGPRPRWSIVVTFIQIFQMVLGIGVSSVNAYLAATYPFKRTWTLDDLNQPGIIGQTVHIGWLFGSICIYFTYLCLFAEVFINRYLPKPKKMKAL